jgi:hypothetical protein
VAEILSAWFLGISHKMATASSLTTKLHGFTQDLLNHQIFHSKRNIISTILKTALSVALGPLFYITWSDYQKWLQLGPAGPPYNIFGYFISILLRPLKASRFDTSFSSNARFLKKIGPVGERTFLKDEGVQRERARDLRLASGFCHSDSWIRRPADRSQKRYANC